VIITQSRRANNALKVQRCGKPYLPHAPDNVAPC
jgi:hypothetical protein